MKIEKTYNALKKIISAILAVAILAGYIPEIALTKVSAQMSTNQKTDVNVIAFEGNSWSAAVLDDEGRVWTWSDSASEMRIGRQISLSQENPSYFGRGAQLIQTAYGDNLPFITQISGAEETTLALDRDGNVWSWGRSAGTNNAALGRPSGGVIANRPGKVEFPDGIKIKWIAAAYQGGKAIDKQGHLWEWGVGTQNILGAYGNNVDIPRPVKIEKDIYGGDLSGKRFNLVAVSDYFDKAAAMAVTEEGEIYTWGNSDRADRGGGSRPRPYSKKYHNIKKISVGNGAYGFLTDEGDIYTWGDNTSVVSGRLGHGNTENLAEPKKIESVKTDWSSNSSLNNTVAAPKFQDFSIYAWSMSAIDMSGNIYGSGETLNSKHSYGTLLPAYWLVKYEPKGIMQETKINKVAEGYTYTGYVDADGNAYVTGGNAAMKGTNNKDGSEKGAWVHFSKAEKAMFTVIENESANQGKIYDKTAPNNLIVETKAAATEIKYVILYEGDRSAGELYKYFDGEYFYDKTFATLEAPYYWANTSPQLLLSPNYNSQSGKYYANPKISEDVFEAAFNAKSGMDKGFMQNVGVGTDASKKFRAEGIANSNCIIWIQSKNEAGTTRMVYHFSDFYTSAKVWHEGVKLNDSEYILYHAEQVDGKYGYLTDWTEGRLQIDPPLGYDIVLPNANELDFWELSPTDQIETKMVDGVERRIYPEKEVVLNRETFENYGLGDENGKNPKVIFTYGKKAEKWADVCVAFVDKLGEPIEVADEHGVVIDQPVCIGEFAPIGVEFTLGQEPYIPPKAQDKDTRAVGYTKDLSDLDGLDRGYEKCSFPDGFKPVISENGETIYIIYDTGMVEIKETYMDISNGEYIKNNNHLMDTIYSCKKNVDSYNQPAPDIDSYVAVGFIVNGIRTDFTWSDDQGVYEERNAVIEIVADTAEVTFLYKRDANGNSIADDEEGRLKVNWIGVMPNGSKRILNSQTFIGNGKYNESIIYFDHEGDKNKFIVADSQKWLFNPLASSAEIYNPPGENSPLAHTYKQGITREAYLYYDEDSNENGVPDKNEKIIEKYKLYGAQGEDILPPADFQIFSGKEYVKDALLIDGYIPVGWIYGEYLPDITDEQLHHVEENGVIPQAVIEADKVEIGAVITFVYKKAAKPVTVKWIGKTYGGSEIVLESTVINGYIGEDVSKFLETPPSIDLSVWIYDDAASSNIPGVLIMDNTQKEYIYRYKEKLDFATITIAGQSADEKIQFKYEQRHNVNEEPFTVKAWSIPGYKVTGYICTDDYGNILGEYSDGEAVVNPSLGSQKIIFDYTSTVTTVILKAINEENNEELYSYTFTDAQIGQKYSVVAPHLDGYVLEGTQNIVNVIDPVHEGTNIIRIYYKKAGNVRLILREHNGRIIKEISVDKSQVIKTAPNLSESYFTFDEGRTHDEGVVFPLRIDDVSMPASYNLYYEKEMMPITVRPVDENLQIIGTDKLEMARKGEMHKAVAGSVKEHTIVEEPSKNIYADPSRDNLLVIFKYKRDEVGDIRVIHFYDGDKSKVLKDFTVRSVVGSKFTVVASDFPGFDLKEGEDAIKEISVKNSNVITFEYVDKRRTIEVLTQTGNDSPEIYEIRKYLNGYEDIIYPPYKSGYDLSGYIIDGGDEVPIDSGFRGVDFTGENKIISNHSVIFIYSTSIKEEAKGYIDITVKGSYGDKELYGYVMSVKENSGKREIEAFDLDGYRVTGDKAKIIDVWKDNITVIFEYISLKTMVNIKMLDENSKPIAKSFTMPAIIGEEFCCQAPDVHGYYLTSSVSMGYIDKVGENEKNEVSFYYKKMNGNVTVLLREGNSTGKIIRVMQENLVFGDEKRISIPDLSAEYYLALSDTPQDIKYIGKPITVTYLYKKQKREVKVSAYDVTNPLAPRHMGSISKGMFKIGEVVSFEASLIEGYKLACTPSQSVVISSGKEAQEIRFEYTTLATDEISVIAVEKDTDNIIQEYSVKGKIGERITIKAINISGWILEGEPLVSKEIPDIVRFEYKRDLVNVRLNLRDSGNEDLSHLSQESLNYRVLRGKDFTAYAPHIPGYELTSKQAVVFSGLTDNETSVTFIYKRIEKEEHSFAKLIIEGVCQFTGKIIYSQSFTVVVGRTESIKSPVIEHFTIDKFGSTVKKITVKEGENKVSFLYNYVGSGANIKLLESYDHINYISGYPDGTLRPDSSITRAEVAAIFFRLIKDKDKNKKVEGKFRDIGKKEWYAHSVNYLASIGIIAGYSDGTFCPSSPISRAEFAALAVRFDKIDMSNREIFRDVSKNYWASKYINSAYFKGWIKGYPDGEFKPEKAITRAEAVKIINVMLNRKLDRKDIPNGANKFTDVLPSHWAYADIIEAAISHSYTRHPNGKEIWN